MLKTLNTKKVCYDSSSDSSSETRSLLLTQFEHQRKLKSSQYISITSYIVQALKNNEYEKIFSYLDEVLPSKELLQSIIDKQGHEFCKYALSYSRSNKVFDFIRKFFSEQEICNALKKEDNYSLEQFFFSQHGAELANRDNLTYRELRIEKFKFILEVAEVILEDFVNRHTNAIYMTSKIKEDYVTAKKGIQMKQQTRSLNSKF